MGSTKKVAIVHDWMLLGGAEKVVEQLLIMYPEAPLYTSCISPEWAEKLKERTVVTGYLNKALFVKFRKFVPFLRQHWFEKLDLSDYDLVISSSGAEAKGINVRVDALHVNYCHAPTHYYWSRYEEYLKSPGFGVLNPLARFGLKVLVKPMRKWDYKAAQKPHIMVANSTHIAKEINTYYGRNATVICPPVDVAKFSINTSEHLRQGFVVAGRQTPYKRFDLAVAACSQANVPLTVVGDGPEHEKLKKLAGPSVTFTGYISNEKIVEHFQRAEGFIFPGLDDFGITPVEAMAAGCPVVAYKAGGALDYVVPGVSGEFFEQQTTESLVTTLQSFDAKTYNPEAVHNKALEFSPEIFRKKMSNLIEALISESS